MVDHLSPEKRSAIMRSIRAKNTKPELRVRQMLHRSGYRFRIHAPKLPGKPDLAFTKRKKVVFVHGCFWHQHPDSECRDAKRPTSNSDYWLPKLKRTQERDQKHQEALRRAGWDVLVLWECELTRENAIEKRVLMFLGPRKWEGRKQ